MFEDLLHRFAVAMRDSNQLEIGVAALALLVVLLAVARSRRLERERFEHYESKVAELERQISKPAPVAELSSETPSLQSTQTMEPGVGGEVVSAEAPLTAEDPPYAEQPSAPTPNQAISAGLQKSRSAFFGRLRSLFHSKADAQQLLSEFEEILITSDLGVKTTERLLARIELLMKAGTALTESIVSSELRALLSEILVDGRPTAIVPERVGSVPKVILVVGVNGVGKTTTIGKLATKFRAQGARVLVGACDTFRAAAVEQLDIWAQRSGVDIERGLDGAKPSTVAYQSAQRALQGGYDVLIVDTAGRLHTRVNLMNELQSVVSIIEREIPGAPHETLLVLDAVTGQNGLQQAREFHEKARLTGIIVTKLDGTPKGGIVVAIRQDLGIPIRYIGVGEKAEDLREFSAEAFIDGLLERTELEPVELAGFGSDSAEAVGSDRPRVRRRRQE